MTDNKVFFIVLVWGTFFHLKNDNKYVLNTVQWDSYWTLTTEAKKLIQMRLYRSDTDTSIDIDTINIWIDHLKCLILNNSFEVKWFTNLLNDKGTIWNTFSNILFVIFNWFIYFYLNVVTRLKKKTLKLSSSHKQALLALKLAYKPNFSPKSY